MCAVTAGVGTYSATMIRQSAALVMDIFDRSLMSIDYARAANADFAAMQMNLLRLRLASDPQHARDLRDRARDLADTFYEDLGISAARSQSKRAHVSAESVRRAVQAWQAAADAAAPNLTVSELQFRLDKPAAEVEREIDILVNLTAGDGFLYREQALKSITQETAVDICATLAGLILTAAVTWFLNRRISGPLSAASAIAVRIAGGDLGVAIPDARCDELGSLLRSMGTMRDSIRAMMQAEVSERRSAQARLMDAIETTHEGVVLVDAAGSIVVTNAQIERFFGPPEPGPAACFTISDLLRQLARSKLSEDSLQTVVALTWKLDRDTPGTMEVCLHDGLWLRVSWCATREGGLVAFFSDITLPRRREAQLAQTNIWFDAALTHMSQGLCVFDHDGAIKIFNTRFAEIYQLRRDQIRLGMEFAALQGLLESLSEHPSPSVPAAPSISDRIAARKTFTEHQHLADGRVIAFSHRPISDGGWVMTYEDVTVRTRSDARISFMARHDPLTGLPNRALFAERLDAALAGTATGGNFALVLIDLDRFKVINDTRGHPVGDRLLRVVAERLTNCSRTQDTVARLGGDEFAIVQNGVRTLHDAQDLATRLINSVAAPYLIDGARLEIGASLGISIAPLHGADQETLLRSADTALYRAKDKGGSSYQIFCHSMDEELQERRALEHDLQQADLDREMELLYQPIMDITPDGPGGARITRIAGFEALLRWHHPTRGLLAPGAFITVAETCGFIERLGAWVLRRACTEAAGWAEDLRIAVNVSPVQFRSGHLIARLHEALAQSGIDPSRLEVEITESTILDKNEATLDTLRQIKGAGVTIALDDFGTGFSSLSYLRSFPFDRIKIDRSFVMDLGAREDATAIVRAILGLGRSLHIPVTAEGVETPEQLAHLQAEGCAQMQGYLFSRPIPAAAITPLIVRGAKLEVQ
jgi:diguanylate cyclase (GGDEF)-like protein